MSKRGSAGGKRTAVLFRKKAIDEYYKNPNICKECNSIIHIKDNEKVSLIKRRKFCSRSCSAIYSNTRRERKSWAKPKAPKKIIISFDGVTKGELFKKRASYQSARSSICVNARKICRKSNLPYECYLCGYDKHVDVAHIKPVSEFDDCELITTINDIGNLIYLCKNHHWELDEGLIDRISLVKKWNNYTENIVSLSSD